MPARQGRGNVTLARRERDLHADPVPGATAVDGSGRWAHFWARAEATASREQRWSIGSHSVRHYRQAARQPRWPASRISQASAACPPRPKAGNDQSFYPRYCPTRTTPFVGGRESGFIISWSRLACGSVNDAVVTDQAIMTYRDLDKRANRVARYLID